MWNTRLGKRTLRGAEADLVSAAIAKAVEELRLAIEHASFHADAALACEFGVPVFDDLTAGQQLAMFHQVGTYLLRPTEAVLPLTAVSESTVAALFELVRDMLTEELEAEAALAREHAEANPELDADPTEDLFRWRSLVWTAYLASQSQQEVADDLEMGIVPTGITDEEVDCWYNLVDWLADDILWDRDFELADCFLDSAPEKARLNRTLLGIEGEYFSAIAPDPLPEQIPQLLSESEQLTRKKPR